MPQLQCPHCGKLGIRVEDRYLKEAWAKPHADNSECVCMHIRSASRISAIRDGGCYQEQGIWVCPWCGTAPAPTQEEFDSLEE